MTAHPHGADELDVNQQTVAQSHAGIATVPLGLTGSPAISVPFGTSREGLPIGVQLVAGHFKERTLLRAAAAVEAASGRGG